MTDWWLDVPRCACGNDWQDRIVAVPRERTTRADGRVGYVMYWKCTQCNAEWKVTTGAEPVAA